VLVFEVTDGEMMAGLERMAREHGITDGAIVSLIGGVKSFVLSTMPADDESQDVVTTYPMSAELHGCGEIKAGKIHVHATMAIQGDRGVAGHLHSATVDTHFVRAYVLTL
jgi:uncharacterized protein